jgi:hypothetical protein
VTVQVILENNYSTPWTEQTPSQLKSHQRQRWHQLEQLADQNGDGTTKLADALQRGVNAGLQIRLIADPIFASRSFSEVLDLLGVALPDRNCKLESKNQLFKIGDFDHSLFDEKSQGRMGP